MKKILSGITGIIAIIAIICLVILFMGLSALEQERAKDHPLSDVLSGKNIETIYFQNGKIENNGLQKKFTVTDKEFIEKIEGVIETATITDQIDSMSIKASHYDEKYMTLVYKGGKKVKVTFYGIGDTLIGFGGKYYKLDYDPPANEFLTYTKDYLFEYDLVDSKGNVKDHIKSSDPFDIDLKEIQEVYSYYWEHTPTILD